VDEEVVNEKQRIVKGPDSAMVPALEKMNSLEGCNELDDHGGLGTVIHLYLIWRGRRCGSTSRPAVIWSAPSLFEANHLSEAVLML
jgi:hypothetical protein